MRRPSSADSPQRPSPPPSGSRMSLPPEVLACLRRRGASSRKGRQPHDQGPLSYTLSLQRNLEQFDELLHHSDPRITRGLAPEVYDLIVGLIAAPRTLELGEIRSLGDHLAGLASFHERAQSLGVSPDGLAHTVNGYSLAEKVHLVDAAEIFHHGPRAARRASPPAPAASGPATTHPTRSRRP